MTIGVSGLLVALLIGLLVWWAFFVRWQPPPSIFDSPVQDVLGYLAMDDFSQLPMEERIQFLIEFSDRFRGMEQSDSATMAAFLARSLLSRSSVSPSSTSLTCASRTFLMAAANFRTALLYLRRSDARNRPKWASSREDFDAGSVQRERLRRRQIQLLRDLADVLALQCQS